MNLIFMGTPDFAAGILDAVLEAGHTVSGVVTQPDKPVGRSGKLQPTAVKKTALEHGLTVWQPEKASDPAFEETLRACEPEVIVVAAFGQILPASILTLPKYGCLNVHASLLPKYRGAAPIQWAVIDGEKTSGVTIMQMGEGLDTGDMLLKKEVVLSEDETGGSLFDRLCETGASALTEVLAGLDREGAASLHPEKQPEESPTPYARMITKADGAVDWTKSAAEIERLVRGLNPWPSAYTGLNGKTLKIWKSFATSVDTMDTITAYTAGEDGQKEVIPGTVVGADKKCLYIRTGDGILAIEELQMEGKKRMAAGDFLRGHAIPAGTVLS